MVKSRSVKRNAKNARGLGRDRAPPLAQARAKPQEVFSLTFFSRLWFGRVFHLFLQLRRSIFCPLAKQTANYALIRARRLLLVGKRPKYLAAHTHKKTLHACIPCSQASLIGKWNYNALENNTVGSSVTVAWAIACVQLSPTC